MGAEMRSSVERSDSAVVPGHSRKSPAAIEREREKDNERVSE